MFIIIIALLISVSIIGLLGWDFEEFSERAERFRYYSEEVYYAIAGTIALVWGLLGYIDSTLSG